MSCCSNEENSKKLENTMKVMVFFFKLLKSVFVSLIYCIYILQHTK